MPRNEATGYLSTVHRLVYIQLPPLLPRNSTLRTACPTSYTLPVRGERATIVFSRPCPIPETRQRGLVPTKYYLQYLKETLLKLKHFLWRFTFYFYCFVYLLITNIDPLYVWIRVITKLPNSEQSYKGKVKTHKYINRQNQSTTGKLWKP
jgi:hypothetical protein